MFHSAWNKIKNIGTTKQGLTYMLLFQQDTGSVVFWNSVPVGMIIDHMAGIVVKMEKFNEI